MIKKRTSATFAMMLAAGMAIAGCSADGGADTPTPTYDKPVDMTLTTWSSDPAIHEIWLGLADEFREDNPELGELTVNLIPVDQYMAQMAIQLTGGDAPDIGWIRNYDLGAWLAADVLYDLAPMKDDPAWEWDKVLPSLSACCEGENGELWAYPGVNTVYPVYYNASAFEAAGVDSPQDLMNRDEWTPQNLRRIAKEMVDSGQVVYGLDLTQYSFAGLPQFFDRWFNASYWGEGDRCGLTDKASIDAIQFFHDMIYVDGSFPEPGTNPNFASADTALAIAPPSFMNELREVDFDWDIAPQPGGDGAYHPQLSQATMVVFNKGEAPELASRLLAYLTSPRGADAQAKVFIPARSTDLERAQEIMVGENPNVSSESVQAALVDTLAVATPDPVVERLPEIRSATNPIIDGLWDPDADVKAVLSSACDVAAPFFG